MFLTTQESAFPIAVACLLIASGKEKAMKVDNIWGLGARSLEDSPVFKQWLENEFDHEKFTIDEIRVRDIDWMDDSVMYAVIKVIAREKATGQKVNQRIALSVDDAITLYVYSSAK